MMGTALALAVVGLLLSAFFSGSETGLYRATRLRLVLDALGGSLNARGLLWLVNRPSLFVATTLLGNNLANYMITLATVMVADNLGATRSRLFQIGMPLLMAPVLFIYGELLPKNLFLQAPNRLLRRVGPFLLGFTVLLAPLSGLLWAVDQFLQRLLRQSPDQIRATLARRELRRILEEGHEAGILRPVQRTLARGIFAIANQPVGRFATPLDRVPRAKASMNRQEILEMAQRYRLALVPVEAPVSDDGPRAGAAAPSGAVWQRPLAGYVRVIDLALHPSPDVPPLAPLLRIGESSTLLAALTSLQTANEELASVVDGQGRALGIVSAEQLRERLLHAGQ